MKVVAIAVGARPELPLLFIAGYAGAELPPGAEVIDKPFDLNTLARKAQTSLPGL